MPDKREKELFIVQDKRKFTAEGDVRDDVALAPEPAAEAPQETANDAEAAKAKIEKTAEPTPEEAAAQAREVPPPPSVEEQLAGHTDYKDAGRQVDNMLKEHGAPANAFREMNFEQLAMSLYMTAMMQLGAVRAESQQPTPPDILGARQTIDTLGMLQEKTKGNLNERESNLLQHSLFELRMTYVEIIKVLSTLPPEGAPAGPGGIVTPGGAGKK